MLCPMSKSPSRKREGLQENATHKKGSLLLTRVRTMTRTTVWDAAGALTQVSNKLPFLRVALFWRPSLFPLRDLDIRHNTKFHRLNVIDMWLLRPNMEQARKINCGGRENDGSWTELVERKKRAFHGGGKEHEQNAFEWICRVQILDVEYSG